MDSGVASSCSIVSGEVAEEVAMVVEISIGSGKEEDKVEGTK